jgi:hypothetical protein
VKIVVAAAFALRLRLRPVVVDPAALAAEQDEGPDDGPDDPRQQFVSGGRGGDLPADRARTAVDDGERGREAARIAARGLEGGDHDTTAVRRSPR